MSETRCETLVVGGGPAGLAQAFWTLQERPEADILVLEAQDRPGGWVHTRKVDGFSLELGPQALRPSDALDAVVAALGIESDVLPATGSATNRWIGRRGELVPIPTGPGQFLGSPILPFSSKLRVLTEPFVRSRASSDPEESVASFVGRRFGKNTEPLVHAMVSGIFAGDADQLELRSAFPIMSELEQAHGSVFKGFLKKAKANKAARNGAPRKRRPPLVSFEGGLQRLTDSLASALGDRLQLGDPVVEIGRDGEHWHATTRSGARYVAEHLTLANPATVSARLLRPLDPTLQRELDAIPFASLVSVYLSFDAAETEALDRTRGFGFLLEPGEESPVLGCLYCSHLFPEQAPNGRSLMRVMMGGVRHPELIERTDDHLVQLAERTLRRYTGLTGTADVVHVERVVDAIPQYVKGHGEILHRLQSRLSDKWPGLELRGNSYRAIALTGQLAKPEAASSPV